MIRAIIDTKTAGSLIGRQGTTIQYIRSQSASKVQISDTIPGIDERIITVTGNTTGIFRAYSFISDKLREILEAAAAETPEQTGGIPNQVNLRILIPDSQAGAIIGKQGAKIKEIREATGATVNLEKDRMPSSSERACTIQGSAEACAQTVFHIACTMLQVPATGHTQLYTPGAGAGGYGGRGGGAGHAGYGHQQQMYGHGGYAQQGYQQGYAQQGYPQQGAGYGAGGYAGGAAQGGGSTQQIPVPTDVIGAIIGRGGSKIKEIRQTSGAQVKIADNIPGQAERVVTMTGTPQAVQMAYYLIHQRITEAMQANAIGNVGQVP